MFRISMDLFNPQPIEELINARVSNIEDVEKVKNEFKNLKSVEQRIIRLRIEKRMEFRDISTALRKKEPTVKVLFYGGIIKLKNSLL